MLSPVSLVALSIIALPAAVAAAQPQSTPPAKDKLDSNQVVCEKVEETGSRLAVRRICMTRAQWAEQRLQNRQDIDKAQTLRPVKGN